jgi:hypothetical protein
MVPMRDTTKQFPKNQAGGATHGYDDDQDALEGGVFQRDQSPQAYKYCPDLETRGDNDEDSEASFPSTAPSSTFSAPPPPPPTAMINCVYEFRCPFEFVGCELSYHSTQIDAYVSHTTTHFLDHRPPPKTVCIFCPQTFENPNDRVANWKERMHHIADHYRCLERFEYARPDFFVIEYMRGKNIISHEDYKWATRHGERHDCDGLVDFGYKTADNKRKEAKSLEERHDMEKEDRHRRRHIASKSKGEGKGLNRRSLPSVRTTCLFSLWTLR